jgi:hypothetical protein
MRDKLVKTGHKKAYYRIKAFFVAFVCALSLTALAAIPIGISYTIAAEGKGGDDAPSLRSEAPDEPAPEESASPSD